VKTNFKMSGASVVDAPLKFDFREFLLRVRRFYSRYGAYSTIRRAYVLLRKKDPYKQTVTLLSKQGNEVVFSKIYENNLWQVAETRSGLGSTIEYTANIRKALPEILTSLNVGTLVDAPCGDFNWMQAVEIPAGCKYLGIDVVGEIVARNQAGFGGPDRSFLKLDITRDRLPKADLIFCRDCLFHLSYKDIFGFLTNFVDSGSHYLMTSTHKNQDGFPNKDILSGDFRVIDLFSEPFLLPTDVLARVDDYLEPDPPREMVVWPREAIRGALSKSAFKVHD